MLKITLILSLFWIFGVFGKPGIELEDLDDRININVNNAHAHALNRGGYSASDSSTVGINTGILYPGNRYRPLGSQTNSLSNSYSTGYRPPHTYANTGSRFGPYGGGGHAGSGYAGGVGQAHSSSRNQQIAIPLGLGGAVFLSNLETEPSNSTGSANPPNSDKKIK